MRQVPPGHFPSGGHWTVFVLRHSPEELAARFDIAFESGADDFDQYQVAAFESWGVGQFWLFRYTNNPGAGTDVLFDIGVERWQGFAAIWDQWKFDIRDLAWVTEWEAFPGPGPMEGKIRFGL